ncbi:opioid growth factor receptor-related protein [Marinobacter halophilus]|nr:opioid growth factor receptor-related protein [Marinobacter halophilus]
MTKLKPAWKVGCAHPVESIIINWNKEATLDRDELAGISPELYRLMTDKLVATASPDWSAILLYAEARWDVIFEQLMALPNDNPDARKVQRRMLGHAQYFDATAPLTIDQPLSEFGGLISESERYWLVCFDETSAELWTEANLLNMAEAKVPEASRLTQFMRGEGPDHQGRTLDEILAFDDFWLEHTHDFVQWLFPIPEASRANLMAPVLTEEDCEVFKHDGDLRQQQRRALDRMLAFYGLARRNGVIEALPGLNLRDHIWLKAGGHNHLRITRIIRSIHYCHQQQLAAQLQAAFISIGQTKGFVSEKTISYWRIANG